MIEKMIRAARLDPTLYNQVEADQNETSNALIIVVLVGIISGLGAAGASLFAASQGVGAGNPIMAFIGAVLSAVLGWIVWSFIIYFVGTRVYNAATTPGELLRTLGYAQSPAILNILGGIPCLGVIISLVVMVWTLVASFIAAREALDLDTTKTLITVILGFIVSFILTLIIGAILGVGALGLGALTGAFR